MLVVKILVSFALVTYAVSRADLAAAAGLLPDARWWPLAAMLIANFLSRLLSAYRWYRLVKPVEPDLHFLPLVSVTLSSSFYGQFLPGGGVETLQILGLARTQSNLTTATASIFADRALGLIATTLFMAIGLVVSHRLGGPNLLPYAVVVCVALAITMSLLVNKDLRTRCARLLPPGVRARLLPFINEKLGYFETFRENPDFLGESVLLAVGMQILRIMMFYFGALALLDSPPIIVFLLAVPAILFLLVLPISVGGIGIRESILVTFFALYGLSEESALALAILVYLGNIIVASPGAWFGWQLLQRRR
jgi:uncharacterized protein (TIRG00374 family)